MSTVSSGGFSFTTASVGGNWSWFVSARNITNLGQTYHVVDIITPYGKFTDVAVPLPGDVVLSMADSITQLQQQLVPVLTLVSGTPTSYALTVTEGDPSIQLAVVPFQNTGAFGSFLTAGVSSDVPWLTETPTQFIGIGKNQQAQTTATLVPSTMLASGSPYTGHFTIQDVNNPGSFVRLTANITVLPRPLIVFDTNTIALTYSIGTGTPGANQQVIVSNGGPLTSILNFTVAKIQNMSPWLAFTPDSGGPLTVGTQAITFSLVVPGITQIPGTYTETIAVKSDNASNTPQIITVNLVVTE